MLLNQLALDLIIKARINAVKNLQLKADYEVNV